jgi:hypothetical protein
MIATSQNKREFMTKKQTALVYVTSPNSIRVDPDPINCLKGQNDIDIEWQIATSGWKFVPNGIEHRDNGDGTFHHPQPGDSKFHWINGNHHAGRYRYNVHVISADGKTPLTLDPAIQNHGDSDDT